MNVPKSVFRQYDVRGLVDRELTPEFARALGRAFASVAHERLGRAPVIAVGRDNRPSGDSLSGGVRKGITEGGGTAIDVGMLPTPALYFAVLALGTDGGLQVTGSHNPPEFNGFKMVLAGDAFHGDDILGLWEIIMAERWRSGAGKETSDGSVLQRYRDGIISRNKLERAVRVVVDCGNGVGSLIAVSTLRGLGAEVTPLFCESDGSFPNHHPDPTVPENLRDLQAAVRRTSAELGIAFDGDADRIGAVDETGEIIYGDQLLVIFGRDAVKRFGQGTPVIFDVKCSEVLPAALAAAGAKPPALRTGDPPGRPSAHLRHTRNPRGVLRGREVRLGRARRGIFRLPLPGEHHRRRADHLPQGVGPAPRIEYPAGSRHALRSHGRAGARCLPGRSGGISEEPKA
jgi:phosphomannomutase